LEKIDVNRPDAGDSFLTVAEVAEMLKLNQQTVRNWIDQGSLPALRVGRLVRIRRSDFERLISGGADGTPDGQAQSAQDFWGGEPVGVAEPAPAPVGAETTASANEDRTKSSGADRDTASPTERRLE
jgi:excisionase family DNA binding protein